MKQVCILVMLCLAPSIASSGGSEDRLQVQLERYFAAVDMSAVPLTAQQEARSILARGQKNTQKTFLRLHTLLAEHEAIVHIDIHGAAQVQTAEKR